MLALVVWPGDVAHAAALDTVNGSATVAVNVYDLCGPGGQRRLIEQTSYQAPAQLSLGRRLSVGNQVEPNPVSLALTVGDVGTAGAISIRSALVFDVGGPLLLTYWHLTASGNQLTGQLVDTHEREAAAANLFNEQRLLVPCRPELGQLPPWPSPLGTGTNLAGAGGSGHANLTVNGGTTDGFIEFQLRFSA